VESEADTGQPQQTVDSFQLAELEENARQGRWAGIAEPWRAPHRKLRVIDVAVRQVLPIKTRSPGAKTANVIPDRSDARNFWRSGSVRFPDGSEKGN